MSDVPQSQQGYPGWMQHFADTSNPNILEFMIQQMLARISTATLVRVESCTVSGVVGPVGEVNVTPLVNLVDGHGNTSKHAQLYNLAYFRVQGGNKAVIMDPKAGDIGIAVFADRDISGVKKNKSQSAPSSYRRFDMADGLFFPCFLGGTPDTYIRFTDDSKIYMVRPGGMCVVVSDKYVQMKKKGASDLHVTVDVDGDQILVGKTPVVGPDPNPGEP